MGEQETPDLRGSLTTQGVWKSVGRRLGQNHLYGSFLNDTRGNAVTQDNPTDHALAAIASILDNREPPLPTDEPLPPSPQIIEADGYARTGPGPLPGLRFKWMVRCDDNGDYFVDETIGESSQPITQGPMTKDAAVALVDGSEHAARARFELLRREIAHAEVPRISAEKSSDTDATGQPGGSDNGRENLA